MVLDRKRTAPDGCLSSSKEKRRDGEAAKELVVSVPSRQEDQEARESVGISGSLGYAGNVSFLQGHVALHEMLPRDPSSLLPQSCLASSMFNLVGSNVRIQQLERLHHLWASRSSMRESRIGVLGHRAGMDRSKISPRAVHPISSIASTFRHTDSPSHLCMQTDTAQQTIQNVDTAGTCNATKVPCRARGMSKGHDFEVSRERDVHASIVRMDLQHRSRHLISVT
jgi:hypothetical protein